VAGTWRLGGLACRWSPAVESSWCAARPAVKDTVPSGRASPQTLAYSAIIQPAAARHPCAI